MGKSMKRRAVVAGIVGGIPLISGCSDPGTTIRLEPETVRVVGDARDEGNWDVTFSLAYELNGLDEGDGLSGVRSHLLTDEGTELERIEHGDLVWDSLPATRRETDESDDGVDYYRGTITRQVSTTADQFPHWIVFTADRAIASGVWSDVSVYGVTTASQASLDQHAENGGETATNGTRTQTNRTTAANQSRSETETENRSQSATETDADDARVDVSGDDWNRVRLPNYDTFPPTDEIPTNDRSTSTNSTEE